MTDLYKKILLSFFVFLLSYSALSNVDSLLTVFHEESNPDVRIELCYEISKLTYRSDPEKCKEVLFEALKDSNATTNKLLIGKNLNILAIVFQYQSEYDTAAYYFNQCLKLAEQIGDEDLKNHANNNIALNYRYMGKFEKAIENYIVVLERHEKNKSYQFMAGVLNDIGNTYLYMRNYEMGLEYQYKALNTLNLLESLPNEALSVKANTLNSIGYTFGALDMPDSAMYYYNKSLIVKKQVNNLFSWCNTKNNICTLLRDEPEKCIECLKELMEVQKEINDRRGIVRAKINLAVSYADLDQHQKGLDENLDILNNYSDVCDVEMIATLYMNIAGSYSDLKDYEKAYKYRKKYDVYQDSLRSDYYNNDILEITEKY